MTQPSRRRFLTASGVGLACSRAALPANAAADGQAAFRYCLNTATLQGYNLDLVQTIQLASKAGYSAIEPWMTLINSYIKGGGSLPDLRKRIADLGLTVESAIAFPQWIVNDSAKRESALEQARRDMEVLAAIGGKRIAAPPAGATTGPEIDLLLVAERYRALLDLGDRMGVVPELELWGGSANLHKLSQVAFVAMEIGHPKACVLPDVFHLYKGGSSFAGLRMLSAQAVPVFHMNDYPGDPPRETISDRDRIYPGDGIAPWKPLLTDLERVNPSMVLSLELFNPAYWKGDSLETARTGLAKMKQLTQDAAAAK